jgi:hypothetical protein
MKLYPLLLYMKIEEETHTAQYSYHLLLLLLLLFICRFQTKLVFPVLFLDNFFYSIHSFVWNI